MLCGTWHEMRRNRRHSLKFRGGFGKTSRLSAIRVLAFKLHDDDLPRLRFHAASLSASLTYVRPVMSGIPAVRD
jgi:hypothetical protein